MLLNCPNGTYALEDNSDKICYDKAPNGYYLDLPNNIYKKCYESCGKCNMEGHSSNNNCLECRANYQFYISIMKTFLIVI